MVLLDAPRIVSRRWEQADAHTLDGYRASGGYAGLRSIDLATLGLAVTPQQVAEVLAEQAARHRLGRTQRNIMLGGAPAAENGDPHSSPVSAAVRKKPCPIPRRRPAPPGAAPPPASGRGRPAGSVTGPPELPRSRPPSVASGRYSRSSMTR